VHSLHLPTLPFFDCCSVRASTRARATSPRLQQ
jgi:hypothetical protein